MKIITVIKARSVIAEHSAEKVSSSLAYKMMKFMKATDDDADFYADKLESIINEYARKDDNGRFITNEKSGVLIDENKVQEFDQQLAELGDTDIAPPSIVFSIEELSEIKISTDSMFKLEPFLIEQ